MSSRHYLECPDCDEMIKVELDITNEEPGEDDLARYGEACHVVLVTVRTVWNRQRTGGSVLMTHPDRQER